MNTSTAKTDTALLSRDSAQPLSLQLAERYAERIQQRLLLPGARLPSVRDCARHHGVSPYTVVAAYDQLLARGLLEARKQRGFFVREVQVPTQRAAPVPLSRAPLSASALIRGMFEADTRKAPGLGTLPREWLDLPLLQSTLRRAMSQDDGDLQLQYGEAGGDARLRTALSQRLSLFGVAASSEQIVSTVGATHALELITRGLLNPGDAVLVDDPGWSVEYARLTQAGMKLLPVPRGAQGPDLERMRHLAEQHRPRLYVTVSVLHNPTGNILTLAAAHEILKLAEAHDFVIVEDDSYADFAPSHSPRLSALDGLQRTVYVGGFSKILTPAWRVGFLAASPARVERLTEQKLLASLTTSPLMDRAVALCIEQGQLRRHAERVLQKLDAARHRTVKLAEDAGCRFIAPPQGLFGWVDVGCDTERLAQPMLDAGWLIAPGLLFSATRQAGTLMRINYATAQDPKFWRLLEKLRD